MNKELKIQMEKYLDWESNNEKIQWTFFPGSSEIYASIVKYLADDETEKAKKLFYNIPQELRMIFSPYQRLHVNFKYKELLTPKHEKIKVKIIRADDWEGIYIDGELIDQGHTLGDGNHTLYLLKLSEKYNFKSKDVKIYELNDEDVDEVYESGELPKKLSKLKGNYD